MPLVRRILLGLAVIFAAIQLVRPARNVSSAPPGPDDISVVHPPPPAVKAVLDRACYDCHSDNTRYPWYANVQPVGWLLAHHVNDGKRDLNFSHFGEYPPSRAARKLTKTMEETERHEMPLWSYTLIHRDARLGPADIAAVSAWARAARAQVNALAAPR